MEWKTLYMYFPGSEILIDECTERFSITYSTEVNMDIFSGMYMYM